jgi:hypothetical protein
LPEAFPVPAALTTTCDDEIDPLVQDGKYPFNTSFDATILNGQTGMTVKYFAQNGVLCHPLPNPFVTGTQNVRVVVEPNQHNLYSFNNFSIYCQSIT